MKKIIAGILLIFIHLSVYAHQEKKFQLESGDLIFQDLDCGGMCDAIEEVTQGYNGNRFSHVGLVNRMGKTITVIEALGGGVRIIPLDSFLKRTSNKMYVGRVKKQYTRFIKKAITFSLKQKGKAYDDAFVYGNDKYYCSELIYDAFKYANHDKPFFQLEPMTFKQPGSDQFYPVWIEYYRKLGVEIPEGEPGCNPGGLSRSPKIEIVHQL